MVFDLNVVWSQTWLDVELEGIIISTYGEVSQTGNVYAVTLNGKTNITV